MFQLKQITPEAIPSALARVERYRLLNEPEEAESICLDVLAIDADNQTALIMLLLALTDQFRGGRPECFAEAQAVLPRLRGEYEQLYYAGIIWERRGTARLDRGGVGSAQVVFPWLERTMRYYEKAEAIRPPGNDDAILRWNTCARLCVWHRLRPDTHGHTEPTLDD